MSWNDPRSDADADADAHTLAAAALLDLDATLDRLRRQVEQQAHRLGTVEQGLTVARQDAANALQAAALRDTSTDRALAYLLTQADAVVLSLEPNGQIVAHAVAEPFYLDSRKGWHSPWIRTARGEVGERAGGALVALWAYVNSQKTDDFAYDDAWPPPPASIIAVRQKRGEDDDD